MHREINQTPSLRKHAKRHRPSSMGKAQKQHTLEVLRKFRQILKSAKKYFQWIEEKCGVSGAQLWVLWELGQLPGMRVSDLAGVLSIKQPSASNLIDKLEKRKLIRRERGHSDRRVVRLYLTKRGEDLIAHAPMPAQGVLPDALSRMPSTALRNLDANLSLLLKLMKLRDKAAAMTPLSDLLS